MSRLLCSLLLLFAWPSYAQTDAVEQTPVTEEQYSGSLDLNTIRDNMETMLDNIFSFFEMAKTIPDTEIMSHGIEQYMKIIARCELKAACIYDSIGKRYLADQNDFWIEILSEAPERELWLTADQQCDFDESIQTRKLLASDLLESYKILKTGGQDSKTKAIKTLNQSVISQMTPLADNGNLFAITYLGEITDDPKWPAKFQEMTGSDAYVQYQSCQEAFMKLPWSL